MKNPSRIHSLISCTIIHRIFLSTYIDNVIELNFSQYSSWEVIFVSWIRIATVHVTTLLVNMKHNQLYLLFHRSDLLWDQVVKLWHMDHGVNPSSRFGQLREGLDSLLLQFCLLPMNAELHDAPLYLDLAGIIRKTFYQAIWGKTWAIKQVFNN